MKTAKLLATYKSTSDPKFILQTLPPPFQRPVGLHPRAMTKICENCHRRKKTWFFDKWRKTCKFCRKRYFKKYRQIPKIRKKRLAHSAWYWRKILTKNKIQHEKRNYQKRRSFVENREKYYHWNYKERMRLKLQIIEAYGGMCKCCGETHPELLCIDHKDGRGAQDRKGLTGINFYRKVRALDFPQKKYQLLCFNCNMALGFFGYCPHHPKKFKRKAWHQK